MKAAIASAIAMLLGRKRDPAAEPATATVTPAPLCPCQSRALRREKFWVVYHNIGGKTICLHRASELPMDWLPGDCGRTLPRITTKQAARLTQRSLEEFDVRADPLREGGMVAAFDNIPVSRFDWDFRHDDGELHFRGAKFLSPVNRVFGGAVIQQREQADPIVAALLDPHCALSGAHRQIGLEYFVERKDVDALARRHNTTPATIRKVVNFVSCWHRGLNEGVGLSA